MIETAIPAPIISFHAWAIFALVWIGVCLVPGPGMAYVMATCARRRPSAAIYTAMGVAIGAAGFATLVGLGLLAFLAASAELFEVLRWLGVAYMIYLAWQAWHAPVDPASPPKLPRREAGGLVLRAILVYYTNPKAMICYVMVFAPFITSDAGTEAGMVQLLVLGGTAVAIEAVFYALLGIAAGRLGRLVRTHRQAMLRNRALSMMFAGAGAALAWAERR